MGNTVTHYIWYMRGKRRGMTMGAINRGFGIACFSTLFLVTALAGCTVKGTSPEVLTPRPQKFSIIVVGSIAMEDKLWDNLVPHFRRGLVQQLNEKKAFDGVLDSAPPILPESAVIFSGKVTEVEKGSAALRWIVGLGAGRAYVKGNFEFRDAGGQVLARLAASESYLGGAGIGGAGFLDMEDLMRRFGETMAERIVQWSRGEKME